jgi:hypothetical protein
MRGAMSLPCANRLQCHATLNARAMAVAVCKPLTVLCNAQMRGAMAVAVRDALIARCNDRTIDIWWV